MRLTTERNRAHLMHSRRFSGVVRCWLLLVAGCTGNADLSSELYERLARDDRSAIYERENEVTIAQSRSDEAKRKEAQIERRIRELDAQWERCRERLDKQNQSARVDGVRKLRDHHEEFLEDQLKIARAHIARRESEIALSETRLDLQKQRQLVKSGYARERTLAGFEERVRAAEREAREAERRELDLRAEAQKKFLAWKAAEADYEKASGDYDSLVWID